MDKPRLNVKLLSTLNSVLYMQAADLRKAAGIAKSTWYDVMRKPDEITVQYLLSIANGLHIPVRRFFCAGRSSAAVKREDLVAEPYDDCYYAGDALRDMINERQDATWKRAGEIAGMNYQSIQKSLSSETRTPVVRFLAVCEAFGIDPFTILVDPNPEPGRRRKGGGRDDRALLTEIAGLREDVGRLSGTVEEITGKYRELLEKYDGLLDAHRALLDRFNSHIRDGFSAIAAKDRQP